MINLRRRVIVLGCQLKKAANIAKAYEYSCDKLMRFARVRCTLGMLNSTYINI